MAITRVASMSVNFCLLLCIVVSINNSNSTAIWNNTRYSDSDVYHVSQMNCKTELANSPSR